MGFVIDGIRGGGAVQYKAFVFWRRACASLYSFDTDVVAASSGIWTALLPIPAAGATRSVFRCAASEWPRRSDGKHNPQGLVRSRNLMP